MKTNTAIPTALLVGLLAAFAQQPAPRPAAPAAQPVQQQANAPLQKKMYNFDVTTQLVIVNVSVKDKDGKPIEGLKANDFTVAEDGKPQTIKVFEYQRLADEVLPPLETPEAPTLMPRPATSAAATAAGLAVVAPTVANKVEPPPVAALVQTDIASSKPGEIKYRDRRLMVMYFDIQGMPVDDQIRAQTGALKFLKTNMTTSDLMAIMVYAGELRVLQDFTNDRDLLNKTINGLVLGEASEMSNQVTDDSAEDTYAAYTQDDTEFNIFNTDRQLSSLETAVKKLASLSEKKALVYVSSGIQRSGTDNDAQLRATINAAIRSNVNVYTIDARGLVATAPSGNASKGSGGNSSGSGNAGNYSGSSMRAASSNLQGSQDTLFALAADTGGKAFQDSNDIALGIQEAQKDISSYYILGYYTTNAALDGKFRKIKVQIGKNLSAKLDYRSGYFASKEFKKFDSSDKERQLEQALALGDPVTDLTIALETDYFRLMRDLYRVPVTIKIPGSDIELAQKSGAKTTKIDFLAEVRDAKGVLAGTIRDNIDVKLSNDTAAQLAKSTVAYDTILALSPGTYTINFLARENETGKMGTFRTKFTIPDLTTDTKYLPISSVILSNQREDQTKLLANAVRDRRLASANPLVQDGLKLIPSVTRVFRKEQSMYVFLEAYEPNAKTAQPIVASLTFYRGKVKAFESEPVEISAGLNANTGALPVRFSVPLSKFEPGRYTCQVSVLNPTGQRFAFWRAPVILLP
jgi:VWFA-related protein